MTSHVQSNKVMLFCHFSLVFETSVHKGGFLKFLLNHMQCIKLGPGSIYFLKIELVILIFFIKNYWVLYIWAAFEAKFATQYPILCTCKLFYISIHCETPN